MTTPTDSGKTKYKRKILLIDKPLQGRIIKSIAWPCAVALVTASGLMCMFCFRLAAEAFEADVDLPSVAPLMFTAAGCLIVTLVLIFYNALKISHRVAGPLYRFRAVMKQIQDGDADARIRIRKTDYLLEFADSMNEFLEWVEKRELSTPTPSQSGAEQAATASASSE